MHLRYPIASAEGARGGGGGNKTFSKDSSSKNTKFTRLIPTHDGSCSAKDLCSKLVKSDTNNCGKTSVNRPGCYESWPQKST